MERNLVSIILPVYNAEKQLKRSVDSILRQSYQNIELILVNDGSVDNSEQVCRAYADQDDRVRLITQENGGPSKARNTGLQNARGQYLQFVDADDYIEANAVELLAAEMEAGNDLAICGFIAESDHKPTRTHRPDKKQGMMKKDFLNNFGELFQGFYINYLWNKMYRLDKVSANQILFDIEMRWGEDLVFNLDYLKHCSKISVMDHALYHYVDNDGSLTTSFNPDLFSLQQKMYEELQEFLEAQDAFAGKNKEIFAEKYTNAIDMCVANLFRGDANLSHKDLKMKVQEIISHPFVRSHKEDFSKGSKQKRMIGKMIHWQTANGIIVYFKSKYAAKKTLGAVKKDKR